MKDAPLLRGHLPLRLVALFFGLFLFALAIVCVLESRLGLPPWDVFHLGIAEHTFLTFGTAAVVVGLVILLVAWIAGARPGLGTVANAIVIGLTVDGLRAIPAVEALSEATLPVRMGLLVAGVLLFGLGSAFYIGAGFGAGPRDSLMLALTSKTGWRIGVVRAAIEVTVLIVGLLLDGVAGVGTVAVALLIGPSVELAFWLLVRIGLAAPGPRHAPEFSPLDLA
jgi:uncharacterized membrane protein YczE